MLDSIGGQISFMLVFLEGILSFFSPCVLPLLPVYMGYLAGNGQHRDEMGQITYQRSKVFMHTLCFVVGVSMAFFILGMGFSALGSFFYGHKVLFSRIGGLIIILLGLFQLGFIESAFLQQERKLPFKLHLREMNPLVALVMGFTFSFAWTPCVGPALSSVLIMASSAQNAVLGNLLVLVYAAGFVIPFLLLGLFTTQVLNFLRSRQNWLRYTIKLGGILLIIMGVMIFTGWMNGVTSYLSEFGGLFIEQETTEQTSEPNAPEAETGSEPSQIPIVDFELVDQYGETHRLSDYEGKVVFLNFWASWCGPCKREMPHIQELYEEYGENTEEVIFLGIANPKSSDYPYNQDSDEETLKTFLEDGGYTFPVVFDTTGEVFTGYRIQSFPTTFMIDDTSHIFGYISGSLTKSMMINIIDQTINSTAKQIEDEQ